MIIALFSYDFISFFPSFLYSSPQGILHGSLIFLYSFLWSLHLFFKFSCLFSIDDFCVFISRFDVPDYSLSLQQSPPGHCFLDIQLSSLFYHS